MIPAYHSENSDAVENITTNTKDSRTCHVKLKITIDANLLNNMAAEEEFHEDNLVGSKSANHENFQIALFLIDLVPFP